MFSLFSSSSSSFFSSPLLLPFLSSPSSPFLLNLRFIAKKYSLFGWSNSFPYYVIKKAEEKSQNLSFCFCSFSFYLVPVSSYGI